MRGANGDILVYIPKEVRWNFHHLPPDQMEHFAMTVVNGQVVLAGGVAKPQNRSEYIAKNTVAIQNHRIGSIPILLCLLLAAMHS